MYEEWYREHPEYKVFYESLEKRRQTRICMVCGQPASWTVVTVHKYPPPIRLTEPDSTERGWCPVCDKHKPYAVYRKNQKQDAAETYLFENYSGPGSPGRIEDYLKATYGIDELPDRVATVVILAISALILVGVVLMFGMGLSGLRYRQQDGKVQ